MLLWRQKTTRVYRSAVRSDVGLARIENQDSFGAFSGDRLDGAPDYLFVVADGMGGHERGKEASKLAVDTVRSAYFDAGVSDPAARLGDSIRLANRRVYERMLQYGGGVTMGTTCTALAVLGRTVVVGHIGDSRAYRITHRKIEQLTQDHSYAEELRREGIISSSEARDHPRRHALVKAIGIEADCEADVFEIEEPKPGDQILLCSDGLSRVRLKDIADVARRLDPQEACDRLVEMANWHGGHDNVTILIVKAE